MVGSNNGVISLEEKRSLLNIAKLFTSTDSELRSLRDRLQDFRSKQERAAQEVNKLKKLLTNLGIKEAPQNNNDGVIIISEDSEAEISEDSKADISDDSDADISDDLRSTENNHDEDEDADVIGYADSLDNSSNASNVDADNADFLEDLSIISMFNTGHVELPENISDAKIVSTGNVNENDGQVEPPPPKNASAHHVYALKSIKKIKE